MKVRDFITQHYEKAKQRGWLPFFAQAAIKYDFPLALLLALASRETNMSNIKGDYRKSKYFPNGGYHGYGIMQVDVGTDAAWIATGAWQKVDQAIMHGAKILDSKRTELNNEWQGTRTLHDFLWTLAASYNHGTKGSYEDFEAHGNPDLGTTGHDYGKDVLERMVEFKMLLDAEGVTATQYAIQSISTALVPQQPASVTEPAAPATVEAAAAPATVEAAATAVAGGAASDPVQTFPTTEPVKEAWYKKLWAVIIAPFVALGIGYQEMIESAKTAFNDNPTALIISIVMIVAVVAIFWKWQDGKTKKEIQANNHAHERDMANLQALQSPKLINAALVPASHLESFTAKLAQNGQTTTQYALSDEIVDETPQNEG